MDSITLGRIQCVRFLVKAALEMLGNSLSFENALDPDTEKSLRINLTNAKCTLKAALTDSEQAIGTLKAALADIEQAIKDAGKN